MYEKPTEIQPEALERWRLTGTFTTLTPLHVGDGGWADLAKRQNGKAEDSGAGRKNAAEYATVFTGVDGRPVIPASSIKGALRAWAVAHRLDQILIDEVFGCMPRKPKPGSARALPENQGKGGRVTFHDAPLDTTASPMEPQYRHWNTKRSTAVTPHVVIDPCTRSAKERLLYFVEYVPEGSVFPVTFTAQGVTEGQRGLLLYILRNAFSSPERPARLGSETADGWGRLEWREREVETLDVRAWLSGPVKSWQEAMTSMAEPTRSLWLAAGTSMNATSRVTAVGLRMVFRFDGPMMINDPTRKAKADKNGRRAVGHATVRRHDGRPYLPASSVRGALRSQARRIWQTVAQTGGGDLNAPGVQEEAPRNGSEKELSGFFKMFGATGWRSPLEVEDFVLQGEPESHRQTFVAIDRFTGGAAPDKLFTAEGLWKPTFAGSLIIRTDRWEAAGASNWMWLLVAYTLRDWTEGDGALGFGVSKGWGRFRAEVEVTGPSLEAELLRGIVRRDPAALTDTRLENWEQSLQQELRKDGA